MDKETFLKDLYKRLDEAIQAEGTFRTALAEKSGVSYFSLRNSINENRNMQITTAYSFAEAIGVSLDYLCGRTDNPHLPLLCSDEIPVLEEIRTADRDTAEEILRIAGIYKGLDDEAKAAIMSLMSYLEGMKKAR